MVAVETSRETHLQNKKQKTTMEGGRQKKKLPVTLLGGFLGSGKTTLLKHILEHKHYEATNNADDAPPFKCAVIVNDVAELNIDKALIDNSSFIQSDKDVIAMQNGCVCCSLKGDLVDQIIGMAQSQEQQQFDYMIIEASGVSEPSQIARMFAADHCNHDDHDHEKHANEVALGDVARLDTCVTVVDAASFFDKLESVGVNSENKNEGYSKLLVEQIEYANVVIVNKADLVSKSQLVKTLDHISILNPKARILTSKYSKVEVGEVVDTMLYKAKDFENFLFEQVDIEEDKQCCKSAISRGEPPCCKRARTFDSGLSTVMLTSKKLAKTRHEVKFGITSFLYTSRRPFYPKRLHEEFIDKYFVFIEPEVEEGCGGCDDEDCQECEEEAHEMEKGEGDGAEEEENQEEEIDEEELVKRLQEEAKERAKVRSNEIGNVMRSKGFLWVAHAHDMMVEYGQAGNTAGMTVDKPWKVLDKRAWLGTPEEKSIMTKDFVAPWGDRRNELVFIGQNMNHEKVQKALDIALLTDEEMAMGVDGWKATIGDMFLSMSQDHEEEEKQ